MGPSARTALTIARQAMSYSATAGARQLHAGLGRPEVVIGNNSILFSALGSILMHRKVDPHDHKDLTFIYPDFWLDHIDERHGKLSWGQIKYELPSFIRVLLEDKIAPGYPSDKLLTWNHFRELRMLAKEKLIELEGVKFITGNPETSIEKIGDRYGLFLNKDSKKWMQIFEKNTYFYNCYSIPRPHSHPIIQRPHTELYKLPIGKLPKRVLVYGAGLSTIWLEKHFKSIEIACLKRAKDEFPAVPSNWDFDEARVIVFNEEEVNIRAQAGSSQVEVESLDGKLLFSGEFYSAIGYTPASFITSELINPDKLDMEKGTPIRWVPSEKLAEVRADKEASLGTRLISPKNIPMGSMIEKFIRINELTHNLDIFAEFTTTHTDYGPEWLKAYFLKYGIHINEKFIDMLEEAINSLDYKLDELSEKQLLVKIFRAAKKPTEDELQQFIKGIDEHQKKLREAADIIIANDSISPSP